MDSGRAINCKVDVEDKERRKKGNRLVADEGGSGHSDNEDTDVPGVVTVDIERRESESDRVEDNVFSLLIDKLPNRLSTGDIDPEREGVSCRKILCGRESEDAEVRSSE